MPRAGVRWVVDACSACIVLISFVALISFIMFSWAGLGSDGGARPTLAAGAARGDGARRPPGVRWATCGGADNPPREGLSRMAPRCGVGKNRPHEHNRS